ncbi:MAG: glycogen synthase, partial [Rhodospirillaceae bacterium]
HNLQYQGWFGPGSDGTMGLPADVFGGSLAGWREDQGGTVSFLKAGLLFSHSVSTVSPTYAQEIMTPEGGKGLDGLLHQRGDAVVGILNGIDQQEWDPARDPHIPTAFFAEAPDGKAACRTALRKRFGLKVPETAKQDGVIFGVVSRLADQKGIDLVLAALPSLLAEGGQLVVVGSGDPGMEAELARLSGVFPGQMAVHVGYDETLAHLVFAGSDAILVPSRFEPCGLTQMYAMRYGALPIARRTGGLADSIADLDAPGGGTGVLFDHALPDALAWAVGRMHDLFRRPESLAAARNRAMAEDFGWSRSAERYRQEYRRLIAAAPSPDLAPDQSAAAQ